MEGRCGFLRLTEAIRRSVFFRRSWAVALVLFAGYFAAGGDLTEFDLENGVILKMKEIPAGNFVMGSPFTEIGRTVDEIPHPVALGKFYLGIYEVTQEQYTAIMKKNPSMVKMPQLPVTMVTRADVLEFCRLLNRKTEGSRPSGFVFSLPTEAQWEYACRAGTTSSLNNGKELSFRTRACPALDEVAWNCYNVKQQEPQPVGQKKPNAWGLYDMHGNVWELCLDGPRIYRDIAEQTDPVQPSDSRFYAARGGSVGSASRQCRSAARSQQARVLRSPQHGFRVALIPEEMANREIDTFPRTFAKLVYATYSVRLGSGVLKMNLVKLGRFHMGSNKDELGHKEDETQHKVRISYDFYMGIYEVTREQYRIVMSGTGEEEKKGGRQQKKGDFRYDGAAVVSWQDAMAFCRRLNEMTVKTRPEGFRFSLPTEAEWEFVCRGTVQASTPSLPSGQTLNKLQPPCSALDRICHYNGNPKHPHPGLLSCHALPVGCYDKTRGGMFDMSGNAAEWCLDTYAPYPFDMASNIELIDPVNLGPGEKVVRGGGFSEEDLSYYRSASRQKGSGRAGFRVVLTPIQWSALPEEGSAQKAGLSSRRAGGPPKSGPVPRKSRRSGGRRPSQL